jgi:hypothetical protein
VNSVSYNGGTGSSFVNNQGGTVNSVSYNGGTGSSFTNNGGSVNSVSYSGGSGSSFTSNGGTVSGVSYSGGANSSFTTNGGTVNSVSYNGGTGSSFTNNGGSVNSVSYNGGTGSGFTNNGGSVNSVSYNGGTGSSFTNNGGTVNSVSYNGGAGSSFTSNGGAVGSVSYNGGTGSSFTNNGGSVNSVSYTGGTANNFVNNGGSANSVSFSGGSSSSFVANGSVNGIVFTGAGQSESFIVKGTATNVTFAAGGPYAVLAVTSTGIAQGFNFVGGSGAATVAIGGTYGGMIVGGAGTDSYLFYANAQGNVVFNEPPAPPGQDVTNETLDFSGYTAGGINLDLSNPAPQLVGPNLTLTLPIPSPTGGIENVVGTAFADHIHGNSLGNVLAGGAPLDARDVNPPQVWNGKTQVVLLDFTGAVHGIMPVTMADETAILNQVQADYQAFPHIAFTLDPNTAQQIAGPGNGFITVHFDNPIYNPTPGGYSDEIDFRDVDVNQSRNAYVSMNGFLGGAGQPADTMQNFDVGSATLAAHECGHLMGQEHENDYGPIGFGTNYLFGAAAYGPTYPGPEGGFESGSSVMASPVTTGSSLFDLVRGVAFNEREAITFAYDFAAPLTPQPGSLLVAQQPGTVPVPQPLTDYPSNFPTDPSPTPPMAQSLNLVSLAVPNTLPSGAFNAGKTLGVAALDVSGSIQLDPVTQKSADNFYSFTGRKGDLMNIQVMSAELKRISNPFDTVLRVYDSSGNLINYYATPAYNDDQAEPTDSRISDLRLPADGTYFIEVDSFAVAPNDPLADPNNPNSPLNPNNPLHNNPQFLAQFMLALADQQTGSYELFLYRFSAGNAGFGNDSLTGGGGNTTFVVGPGNQALTGGSGSNTVLQEADANFILTNSTLKTTDLNTGQTLGTATLNGIPNAILIGGPHSNSFTVSGWSGTGSLVGNGPADTVVAAKSANFTLTNSALQSSDGMMLNLSNLLGGAPLGIEPFVTIAGQSANLSLLSIANLTTLQTGEVFTVSGWTGTGSLSAISGTTATVAAAKNADFTLGDTALQSSDGMAMSLNGVTGANLNALGNNMFDVSGWTYTGSLTGSNGYTATVVAQKDADFLANSKLQTSDGMSMLLNNVGQAILTAVGTSNRQLDASSFPGNAVLIGNSGQDKLIGGHGRDILIGGSGSTRLNGGSGDTIMIAGYTIYDDNYSANNGKNNYAALEAILAEWASTDSYNTRVGDLKGTATNQGLDLNGGYFFNAATLISNPNSADTLGGGSGMDWFWIKSTNDNVVGSHAGQFIDTITRTS